MYDDLGNWFGLAECNGYIEHFLLDIKDRQEEVHFLLDIKHQVLLIVL